MNAPGDAVPARVGVIGVMVSPRKVLTDCRQGLPGSAVRLRGQGNHGPFGLMSLSWFSGVELRSVGELVRGEVREREDPSSGIASSAL